MGLPIVPEMLPCPVRAAEDGLEAVTAMACVFLYNTFRTLPSIQNRCNCF